MTRPLAAATALIFGLSTIAQAAPTLVAAADAGRMSASSETTWSDPPRRVAAVPASETPVAPATRPAAVEPAPAPAQPAPAQPAPAQPAPAAAEPTKAFAPARASAPAPAPAPAPTKRAGDRSATYKGGEGATWKTARNAYGFSGSYGGCRYTGHAGPRGFSIDRVC